jgi:nitrogenase subunit NifH
MWINAFLGFNLLNYSTAGAKTEAALSFGRETDKGRAGRPEPGVGCWGEAGRACATTFKREDCNREKNDRETFSGAANLDK